MPQVSRTVVINVKPEEFAKVLDDFESYVDFLPEVKAISTSNDTDKSVDMLEFSDANGGLTALHFESHVDGDS